MARLFPRPIISPDFGTDGITFRVKAPEAKEVLLQTELNEKPMTMQKDEEGVWSITITENVTDVFKYCFLVDGTQVADPSNMYLSPDKGFKYSVCNNPANPYSLMTMGDIPHGKICYDLNDSKHTATYYPPTGNPTVLIYLVYGKDDTSESWFKVGGAEAIADKLLAEGKTQPCIMVTDASAEGNLNNTDMKVYTLKASDYKTWPERRKALEQLLLNGISK